MSKFHDIVSWSNKAFRLMEFIEMFSLPQFVKIQKGKWPKEEMNSLKEHQVLMLHSTREFDVVISRDYENNKLFIPLNTTARVEIVQQNHKLCYERVDELSNDFPAYVKVLHNHQWLGINQGEVLKLKSKITKRRKGETTHGQAYLQCEKVTSPFEVVEIPLDYKAAFQTLGGCPTDKPCLSEVLEHCKLPIKVKFIDKTLKIKRRDQSGTSKLLGFDLLGEVMLIGVYKHHDVVATTTNSEGTVSGLSIPLPCHVRVVATNGALKGSKKYASYCKEIHKEMDRELIEELSSLKLGGSEVFIDDSDYEEVAPQLKQNMSKKVQTTGGQNDFSESSEGKYMGDYDDVMLPTQNQVVIDHRQDAKNPPQDKMIPKILQPRQSVSLPGNPKETSNANYFKQEIKCVVGAVPLHRRKPRRKLKSDSSVVITSVAVDQNARQCELDSLSVDNDTPDVFLPNVNRRLTRQETTKSFVNEVGYVEMEGGFDPAQVDKYGKAQSKHRQLDDKQAVEKSKRGLTEGGQAHVRVIHGSGMTIGSQNVERKLSRGVEQRSMSFPAAFPRKSSAGYDHVLTPWPGAKVDRQNDVGKMLALMVEATQETKAIASKRDFFKPSSDDMTEWTVTDVSECLKFLNLGKYVESFRRETIDGSLFLEMDEDMLKALEITNILHLKKLLKVINQRWIPKL